MAASPSPTSVTHRSSTNCSRSACAQLRDADASHGSDRLGGRRCRASGRSRHSQREWLLRIRHCSRRLTKAFCSITTGAIVGPPYAGVAFEGTCRRASAECRSEARGTFSVAAGSSTTFRLVWSGGRLGSQARSSASPDAVLTALSSRARNSGSGAERMTLSPVTARTRTKL